MSDSFPLLLLSAHDVHRALPMDLAIETQREAFRALASGEAQVPLRAKVGRKGTMIVMPARAGDELATKIVSVFPENPSKGLPLIHGLVLVLDPETGRPAALVEGGALTAIRTGAATGAAADALARADARVGAIIGTGAQAETQLLAMACVRPLDEVRIHSPSAERVRAFVDKMQPRVTARLVPARAAREAVRGADIVVTATTSKTPVFDGGDLSPGAHVSAVGAYTPDARELDAHAFRRASVVCIDDREAARDEAGDVLLALRDGALQESSLVTLGEVLSRKAAGRTDPDAITIFKSVGVAVQDVTAAAETVRRARSLGLGTRFFFDA